MTKILNGLIPANEIKEAISSIISHIQHRKPCLVTILTTDNPASKLYVKRKLLACKEVGIEGRLIETSPQNTKELLNTIYECNSDASVDGILVQMPLARHIDKMQVLETIDPKKDVDGFHPINIGRAFVQDPKAFYPCTPLGIKKMLEFYKISVHGKHVVIVGRSHIVGKPLASLLLQDSPGCNATVTVAHSKTLNLEKITKSADILISAIGKPYFIKASMVQRGAVVIDVGSNSIEISGEKKRVVGDVDFENVMPLCSAISPVPNGVGPMTIAMLLENTMKSFLLRNPL